LETAKITMDRRITIPAATYRPYSETSDSNSFISTLQSLPIHVFNFCQRAAKNWHSPFLDALGAGFSFRYDVVPFLACKTHSIIDDGSIRRP
jgi:hypothetical protein